MMGTTTDPQRLQLYQSSNARKSFHSACAPYQYNCLNLVYDSFQLLANMYMLLDWVYDARS